MLEAEVWLHDGREYAKMRKKTTVCAVYLTNWFKIVNPFRVISTFRIIFAVVEGTDGTEPSNLPSSAACSSLRFNSSHSDSRGSCIWSDESLRHASKLQVMNNTPNGNNMIETTNWTMKWGSSATQDEQTSKKWLLNPEKAQSKTESLHESRVDVFEHPNFVSSDGNITFPSHGNILFCLSISLWNRTIACVVALNTLQVEHPSLQFALEVKGQRNCGFERIKRYSAAEIMIKQVPNADKNKNVATRSIVVFVQRSI